MADNIYTFDGIRVGNDTINGDTETKIVETAAKISKVKREFVLGDSNVAISDENGNVVFDSKWNVTANETFNTVYEGLSISDEEGNIVAEFNEGLYNTLNGKKFSILGDSISTYGEYLPEGFGTYYPRGDVNDVQYTWWKLLESKTGMKMLKNASWSGSRTIGDSQDATGRVACSDKRIAELADGSTTPDVIIVEIGTNDFGYNSELGEYAYGAARPSEGQINTFCDAYSLMLYKIHQAYPFARVYCCTIIPRLLSAGVSEYVFNDLGLTLSDYSKAIKKIAYGHSCPCIDLELCGLNIYNIGQLTVDMLTHPNKSGMELLSRYMRLGLETK